MNNYNWNLATKKNDFLAHYGILGMKWGVRRYQNADGSLTAEGRARYDRMSDRQLQRTFKRQIQSKRKQVRGSGNQWMRRTGIGTNSNKVIKEQDAAYRKATQTKEYKQLDAKRRAIENRANKRGYWDDNDDKAYESVNRQISKVTNYSKNYGAATLTNKGWKYTKDYINGGGHDLSVAYLKDLGYGKDAERYVRRLAKHGLTLNY